MHTSRPSCSQEQELLRDLEGLDEKLIESKLPSMSMAGTVLSD